MAASPECILCRRVQFFQGLLVMGHFICHECESKIIFLDIDDPDYEHYKWGLKKIWNWSANA